MPSPSRPAYTMMIYRDGALLGTMQKATRDMANATARRLVRDTPLVAEIVTISGAVMVKWTGKPNGAVAEYYD